MHSVVIHAHFYQPPREDPWFEEIEREPDAEPYHDWTARVAAESYRGVVAARVLDGEGRIRRVVNALAYTSFDVGPSLLAWLARRMPTVHDAIVAADRESRARVGHGNALAHPYDHVVLPLLGRRDKVTTVRWGIADFVRRFGRAPEGMWLPETGVDDETLDVLAEQGIRFTVLAGHQVTDAPPDGAPGLYTTASGREIALFVYDGKRSADVAFGGLLRDGRRMAEQLAEETAPADGDSADSGRLVAIATDGETYGHHHRFGDMALAAAVDILERDRRVRLENFAAYLARHPATRPVGIVAPSAWSCGHGVDRWRLDCGCRVEPGTQQRWRAPLREAVDGLTADAHALFEREGPAVLGDPWAARDRYEAGENGERGPLPRGAPTPDASEVRARALLEMERHVLRANTSCAWFFDDLARPEPRIVLRAAARVIELAGLVDADAAREMERRLLERLARARRATTPARERAATSTCAARARRVRPRSAWPPATPRFAASAPTRTRSCPRHGRPPCTDSTGISCGSSSGARGASGRSTCSSTCRGSRPARSTGAPASPRLVRSRWSPRSIRCRAARSRCGWRTSIRARSRCSYDRPRTTAPPRRRRSAPR
ncbi:Protein of unknown function DUF3536 [Gemmatirosa kalamazoonensis]|uniref:Glycoside hydrolase family 57 N-terminal domain-containing protein n=1 Tax=Gemmatirosa kalamazoonensis TaxID=861299 RepID=W0RA24_9BACT|nr:DUF3536 domain-containing protein [Gemmatirosa kalamazoonensis]AHG87964.1 Protein of unknown function DUF3536 [Gemmatirosa kalamazoonensis]